MTNSVLAILFKGFSSCVSFLRAAGAVDAGSNIDVELFV